MLVLPSSWTSRRPQDAKLLQRHFGLSSTNGFRRAEVKYRPAREWSAWFYLGASPERLSRLLADQRFSEGRTIQTNEVFDLVSVGLPPLPQTLTGAKVFERRPAEDVLWHYAVLSPDGTKLWSWIHRF